MERKRTDIKESSVFFETKEAQDQAEVKGFEKLYEKVKQDVKSFTKLMHDACVRFYQLDARQSLDSDYNECLANLITSFVLKSPVYTVVHILIQDINKSKVYKIAQTIDALRRHHNLEKDLGIDAVKNGRLLLRCRYRLAEIEAAEDLMGSAV